MLAAHSLTSINLMGTQKEAAPKDGSFHLEFSSLLQLSQHVIGHKVHLSNPGYEGHASLITGADKTRIMTAKPNSKDFISLPIKRYSKC